LILADLDEISITSMRTFANDEEYRKYMRFRSYAFTVFPYAKEAIRIFREYEYAQQHMSKKDAKKQLKKLEDELTKEFEEPLKKLTKLQGKIMIKMIEKELGQSMYDLLKGIKGSFSAFYWNAFSKLYSYDLKEGYNRGTYPILDAVMDDFDVSHRIESNSSLKYITIDKVKKK
jgi:seryl-tRNA(Sec) selenium transferase